MFEKIHSPYYMACLKGQPLIKKLHQYNHWWGGYVERKEGCWEKVIEIHEVDLLPRSSLSDYSQKVDTRKITK